MRKPVFGFLTRSNTNQAVQPQKMVRGLKFKIKEEGGLHYLPVCSKNNGVEQLCGNVRLPRS